MAPPAEGAVCACSAAHEVAADVASKLSMSPSPLCSLHILDPLSPSEVTLAAATVKGAAVTPEEAAAMRFMEVSLHEPEKEVVAAALDSAAPGVPATLPPREAKVTTYNRDSNGTTVWLVQLGEPAKILSSTLIPDVQPPIHPTEFEECEAALKKCPEFIAAMKRRGVEDMDLIMVDPWSVGYYSSDDAPARRLAMPLVFSKAPNSSCSVENGYAHPVEGLWILFDLQRMGVVTLEDREVVPLAPTDPHRNYTAGADRGAPDRTDLRAVEILQPEGPSFAVDGYTVQWQKWSFHVGFTAREGLVLHNLGYDDGAKGRRSVAHRLSVAEMVVPYGDPFEPHYRKNAFDEGEYGLGKNAQSLTRGCDCLGHIHYFDATLSTFEGGPLTIRNAVCMHEEDFGILWKHMEWRTGHTEVRRSRRLVLSFICTVANYEYGFFWYLYQDGRIELQVKLTGILSVGGLRPGETRKYGTVVAPGDSGRGGVYAPFHQHFFVARLDMALDCRPGEKANQVVERNVVTEEVGPTNPHKNAFYVRETLLESELQAGRDIDTASARHWVVRNPKSLNRMGVPVGYKLAPGANCKAFAHPEAMFRRRAGFLEHNLWVTAYSRDEQFPAGEFPNQNPRAGDGLTEWVKRDRPLGESDVVLWYVLGITHLPRPEDWPVMPCEYIGFSLVPSGFFDFSPAMDIPPSKARHGTCS